MKKILLTALFLGMTGAIFAAHQYSPIKANKGAGVVVNDNNVNLSINISGSMPEGGVEFGWYLMDSAGNSLNQGGIIDLVNGSANLGSFNKGDMIGFWIKDEDGNYMDSYHRDDRKGDDRYAAYIKNNGKDNIIIGMGDIESNGWSPIKPDNFDGLIFEVSNEVAGQPLPGVLSSILVGGSLLGGAYAYRKNIFAKKAKN